MHWLTQKHVYLVLGGAVTGILGSKIIKSQTVRSLAVQGLAKGMILKDSAVEGLANLQDEAETLCKEARDLTRQSADLDFDYDPQNHVEPSL